VFTGIRVIYVRWKLIKSDLGQYSGKPISLLSSVVLLKRLDGRGDVSRLENTAAATLIPADPAESGATGNLLQPRFPRAPLIFVFSPRSELSPSPSPINNP